MDIKTLNENKNVAAGNNYGNYTHDRAILLIGELSEDAQEVIP